jgi:hypothetical protein
VSEIFHELNEPEPSVYVTVIVIVVETYEVTTPSIKFVGDAVETMRTILPAT